MLRFIMWVSLAVSILSFVVNFVLVKIEKVNSAKWHIRVALGFWQYLAFYSLLRQLGFMRTHTDFYNTESIDAYAVQVDIEADFFIKIFAIIALLALFENILLGIKGDGLLLWNYGVYWSLLAFPTGTYRAHPQTWWAWYIGFACFLAHCALFIVRNMRESRRRQNVEQVGEKSKIIG